MKVPTDATKVFSPVAYTGTAAAQALTTGFPIDMVMWRDLSSTTSLAPQNSGIFDRLRSNLNLLQSSSTASEDNTWGNSYLRFDSNTQILITDTTTYLSNLSKKYVTHSFQRAPSFFDEVCYTGDGSYYSAKTHNLGVVPQFIIVRNRSSLANWWCYHIGLTYPASDALILNSSGAVTSNYPTDVWGVTSTTFNGTGAFGTNVSGNNFVAYLFATTAGVSKVGSYTGNGTTQSIACGFSGGARFVLIRRSDSTGDWYVWDTARGMVSGTDPSLLLNSTAAEINANSIYTATGGFQIVSTAAGINASGGSYIFLAIA
jgi:hypothetical protein